ncbi:MAG: DUF106 domain-containing protein [Candidatus Lokiarchaeota archaeon]|nr:DUF106 domain-containing protein [Candidatus Lokiarchaeota archaeon]
MVLYDWYHEIPGSMFAVLLLSFLVALITAGITKLLVDTEEVERKQRLIKAHQEEKAKILELVEVDQNRYRKARKRWEKKDDMIKKVQQKLGLQRMKPTCISCLPMFILFFFIRGLFENIPIAQTGMNASDVPIFGMAYQNMGGFLNFMGWYFLCSFGMNTLTQRLLKIQTQTSGGGMGQMFGQSKAKNVQFPDI